MRRVLAASLGWDGPGEGSAELSYFVGTAPSGVSQADFTTAIQTALDAWSQVADIRFVQTHQAGQSDSLDFTSTSLDGAGRTLAQAYFPDDVNSARVAGDIQFDRAEQWEIGNSLGSRAFDLVLVAAHEIGHALGLDHTSATDSVMQDSVSPNQQFVGLGVSDVAAIQSLYASAATTLATNTDTQSTTNTDFGWYWQNGGPLSRASFFPGMSANVPAHHHLYHGTDVNQDSQTSSMDALLIINLLNRGSANSGAANDLYVDVNGDSFVTSLDALAVINLLNRLSSTPPLNAGQGEASNTTPLDDTSVESESILDTAENSTDDATDDAKDDATEVDCHLPVIGNDSIAQNPLVRLDSVSLFVHYDANGDGTLSEAEVPARTWQRLLDAEVDTNTDLSFSVEEVDRGRASCENSALRTTQHF
jgi:hypothetical protein